MAWISRGLAIASTALWIAGCAEQTSIAESEAVFANPAAYVGKQVRLCGYFHYRFEDHTIWSSRSASLQGSDELGFFDDDVVRARKLDGKFACVKVEIVRTGLGEDGKGSVVVSTAMTAEFGANRVAD